MKKMKTTVKSMIYIFAFCIIYSCSKSNETATNTDTTGVTDVDGNIYKKITIGSQTWTTSNLTVTKYRNGDPIPQAQNQAQLTSMTTGGWCYYLFNSSNGPIYGKLYNWYAVNDPRGLAPSGYHIPSKTELITLSQGLGSGSGGFMKEMGTTHWNTPNAGATNSSGFTALPGGGCSIANGFSGIGTEAGFWTSTPSNTVTTDAEWYGMNYDSSQLIGDIDLKTNFLSVRCIKD